LSWAKVSTMCCSNQLFRLFNRTRQVTFEKQVMQLRIIFVVVICLATYAYGQPYSEACASLRNCSDCLAQAGCGYCYGAKFQQCAAPTDNVTLVGGDVPINTGCADSLGSIWYEADDVECPSKPLLSCYDLHMDNCTSCIEDSNCIWCSANDMGCVGGLVSCDNVNLTCKASPSTGMLTTSGEGTTAGSTTGVLPSTTASVTPPPPSVIPPPPPTTLPPPPVTPAPPKASDANAPFAKIFSAVVAAGLMALAIVA
jgi:hypothetical protein